ncbi:MAG TPA: TlpA disulfide reductase family protein [Solimonas sp.]|nr:TlpA disulfide reductase family protein [Solimonas sp.]
MRTTLLVLALALGAALSGVLAYRWLGPTSPAGEPLPALRFTDLQGQPQDLAQWRGRWLLLNFWASWCAPCMDELPHLVEAQSLYGARGLQIVGPALDDPEAVKPLIARFRINYPVLPDYVGGDNAMKQLGNTQAALPYSVLVDPQGRIVETVLGGLDREELLGLLQRHLGP